MFQILQINRLQMPSQFRPISREEADFPIVTTHQSCSDVCRMKHFRYVDSNIEIVFYKMSDKIVDISQDCNKQECQPKAAQFLFSFFLFAVLRSQKRSQTRSQTRSLIWG